MTFNSIQYFEYGKSRVTSPVIPAGLVSYHRFNGDALDSVGTNNGTVTNGSYITGVSGQAIQLAVGNVSLPQYKVGGSTAFSVSCMVKFNATGNQVIFGSWQTNTEILIWLTGGNISFWLYTTGTSSGNFYTGWTDTTNWNHFVATYDGTVMKMYLNSVVSPITVAKTGTVRLGSQAEAWGRGGSVSSSINLDGGGLWNRALTQTDVNDIYALQIAGIELR